MLDKAAMGENNKNSQYNIKIQSLTHGASKEIFTFFLGGEDDLRGAYGALRSVFGALLKGRRRKKFRFA